MLVQVGCGGPGVIIPGRGEHRQYPHGGGGEAMGHDVILHIHGSDGEGIEAAVGGEFGPSGPEGADVDGWKTYNLVDWPQAGNEAIGPQGARTGPMSQGGVFVAAQAEGGVVVEKPHGGNARVRQGVRRLTALDLVDVEAVWGQFAQLTRHIHLGEGAVEQGHELGIDR